MTDPDHILVASGLHKTLGKAAARVHVLRGLNLRVRDGEFLAVMGPSGCGKSTLLHLLGLLTPQDEGTIRLGGHPKILPGNGRAQRQLRRQIRRREIGFVFQRFNLLGVLSAEANVEISLRVRNIPVNGQVRELFEAMDVADVMHRKPGQMSIGQQQRVAVVRALAHRPKILLADEPTGNLDSDHSTKLLELFRQINRQEKQTIVMITHSREAADHADRLVHMKDGVILDPDR